MLTVRNVSKTGTARRRNPYETHTRALAPQSRVRARTHTHREGEGVCVGKMMKKGGRYGWGVMNEGQTRRGHQGRHRGKTGRAMGGAAWPMP